MKHSKEYNHVSVVQIAKVIRIILKKNISLEKFSVHIGEHSINGKPLGFHESVCVFWKGKTGFSKIKPLVEDTIRVTMPNINETNGVKIEFNVCLMKETRYGNLYDHLHVKKWVNPNIFQS